MYMTEDIVYKCKTENWNYIGLIKGNLKARISKHDHSIKNTLKEHETELSTKMWELKRSGETPILEWEALTKAKARLPNQKHCQLCNKEAIQILRSDTKNINSRAELVGYCVNKRWNLLLHIKANRKGNKIIYSPQKG